MSNKQQYITFEIKDLITTIMVLNNKTEIAINDIYDLSKKLYAKMKKEKITGTILYSNVYLKEFEREYSEDFYVGNDFVLLNKNHDIHWIIEHFASFLPLEKLELLGFLDDNKKEITV